MKNHDPMGDRLKALEQVETSRRCDPAKPICVRLDGRAFSTFTQGLARPYDERMSRLMIDTTKFLVKETRAKIGYTQSDEITLVYAYEGEAQPLFGGKIHKLTSLIAGLCSAMFNNKLQRSMPEKWGSCPSFDARVFQVPDKMEAANVVLWRWFDARKNSVSMLAQSVFSHKALQNKDCREMKGMLLEKGYDWDTYPDFFKWGTFVQRKTVERELTEAEASKIPEQHRPKGKVLRSQIDELAMPPFVEVANRVEVIFDGAEAEKSPI
jgi:tRNA(His) 5'-end guanylyltransferase